MSPADDALDRRARHLHAASLGALSPRVQAQLVQRRRAATATPSTRGAGVARWGWAGAAATACVLVVALQVRPPTRVPLDAPRAIAAVEPVAADPGVVLAEDPEFYLWLASTESRAYAVE